ELTDVHVTDLALRIGPRRYTSADPTRIRDYGTNRWWYVGRPQSQYALVPSTIHRAIETNRWRTAGRGQRGRQRGRSRQGRGPSFPAASAALTGCHARPQRR